MLALSPQDAGAPLFPPDGIYPLLPISAADRSTLIGIRSTR
jgi:hypothetical protein